MSNYPSLHDLLRRLGGRRVLVLGDLMLDEYIWGEVTRISPEAPVPVVRVKRRTSRPGGAGNVTANLRALGAEVMVFSVVGDDEAGREVIDDLVALGADTSQVTVSHERPTVRKTRVIAHSQQVVRIDHEDASAVNGPLAAAVAEGLLRELPRADALLVSDYSKGMVTALALDPALAACRATGKVITGDAKPPNFSLLTGATLLTPNEAETSAAAGIAVTDDATLAQAAKRLLTKFAMQALLVTRSERGMSLFTDPERPPLNIPAVASEVYDVTGAGDTVIACATLALAAGADFADAARLANYAAGVVVKKVGAACASPDEIAALMEA